MMRPALFCVVAVSLVGCATPSSDVDGLILGTPFKVAEALFTSTISGLSQLPQVVLFLVDKPGQCSTLQQERLPVGANVLAVQIREAGSFDADTGHYTVVGALSWNQPGNRAQADFFSRDTHCPKTGYYSDAGVPLTRPDRVAALGGSVVVTRLDKNWEAQMAGTLDLSFSPGSPLGGEQPDKVTGTFDAVRCNVPDGFSPTCD